MHTQDLCISLYMKMLKRQNQTLVSNLYNEVFKGGVYWCMQFALKCKNNKVVWWIDGLAGYG